MTVQFFKTPGGEELAILTRADYEALVEQAQALDEDEADIAMYDSRKAQSSALLPTEVTAFLLRGDSLLKAIRRWRDETQMHIEFKTGISQSFLSDLESGRRKGSAETLAKLAEVYEVPPSWFSDQIDP